MSDVRSQQVIAILRLIAKGHSYAQIVDRLSGVTYQDIFAAADEALKAMEGGGTRVGYVETVRQTHQRAYEPWDDEEDAKLTPQERRVLEGRIDATDREIDQLVYSSTA